MNITRKTLLILSVCVLAFIFLVREFLILHASEFRLVGEMGVAFLETPSGAILSFGEKDSSRGQAALRAIQPYFAKQNVFALDSQDVGSEFSGKDFTAQIFSSHIFRVVSEKKVFWFLGEVTEEEIENLKKQPISFESDFWVLLKSNGFVGTGLEIPPREGIAYLGERKPLKALTEFAKTQALPLISTKETEGFQLTWSGKTWKVLVRK